MLGTPPAFILSQDQTLDYFYLTLPLQEVLNLFDFLTLYACAFLLSHPNYCFLEIVGNLSLFLLFRFCFWFSLNRFLFDSNFYTMKFSMFSAFPSPAFTLPSRPRPLPGELFYCIACLSVCQALFLPFFIFSALRLLPSDSSVILSNLLPLVNLFTYLFLIIFSHPCTDRI